MGMLSAMCESCRGQLRTEAPETLMQGPGPAVESDEYVRKSPAHRITNFLEGTPDSKVVHSAILSRGERRSCVSQAVEIVSTNLLDAEEPCLGEP